MADHSEAVVRSEIDTYVNEVFNPRIKEIWKSNKDYYKKWNQHTRASIRLYESIIQTLNKYGTLFPEQPKGYFNVEVKSVH